jgi:hypothetical protein
MIEKFETMPDGWKIDRSWGSPEFGWQPIHNGRSLLNGGRKGLLRVHPTMTTKDEPPKQQHETKKERQPDMSVDEVQAIAETMNTLARAKFKETLLQELLFDLQVCKLEGWDCESYVVELKKLIDETYRKVMPRRTLPPRVEQCVLF